MTFETDHIERKALYNSVPFSKESRSDHVATIIRDGISSGIWRPGDTINDQELSKELGVSRTSVREALSRLVESRVVERVHWKGYHVRQLEWQEIENLVDVRLALERLAFSKAFPLINEEIITQLRTGIQATEETIVNKDLAEFMKVDPLFHETMYKLSANEWIPYILNRSLILINVLRYLDKGDDFEEAARASVKDHKTILEAIEQRDLGLTLARLEKHILSHKERLKQEYLSDGPAAVHH